MDASDTYPVAQTSNTQIAALTASGTGAKPRTAPAAVATPFPPRNRTKAENTCPMIAATPSAMGIQPWLPALGAKATTGIAPLATSNRPAGTAYRQPSVRYRLVAPR